MKRFMYLSLLFFTFNSNAFSSEPAIKCKTSGCSGIICIESTAEDMITTCEYKSYYGCFRQHSTCLAISNKCQWKPTEALIKCLQQKQAPEKMTNMFKNKN